ncbi:D-alanyl-D-alanine carboxypeptidase family protein [Sutcliffiella rhizosphaerae]|uniref:D-alanyl-D-alanine carboxypeptidase family protein n=1 Tax=Sutcliffiella rhizosphaerae TaxID=2880967 RepID=UPI001E403D64|nr:D-alanyl-D-alanine carboxypeptidase family protein [Sutcliffiella rhizosphaerae]
MFIMSNAYDIHALEPEELFSETAIVIDTKSGDILYEKDSDRKMYPASITKIVTAIIAIEDGDLQEIVTVSKNARNQDGSRVYLLEGEQLTLEKLLLGLMINSGNDAGTAIAEHFDRSERAFAKRMNTFVKEKIGTEDTNFTNPHGLFHPDHVTTAKDMAKITNYAMKNDTFREIVGTKVIDWVGEGWETTLYNHHRLLWDYEGTTGVKNGYVPESGHTLVTSAQKNGMELIAVTMNASSKYYSYYDTMALLDYGFQNFTTEMINKGQLLADAMGQEYMLAKNIYVAKQEDDSIKLAVSKDKQLVVQIGNEEKIKEDVLVEQKKNDLNPVPSKNTNVSASIELQVEKESNFITIVLVFIGLCMIILIVSVFQKKRRRKKMQERYTHSIAYSRRSRN